MIVKILLAIAAVLCTVNGTIFTYCGFVALAQGSMENVAKSAALVALMVGIEILCLVNLTNE